MIANMRRVIDSSYGALFEGDSVGCANPGATALYTGYPFSIAIWFNIFNPNLPD